MTFSLPLSETLMMVFIIRPQEKPQEKGSLGPTTRNTCTKIGMNERQTLSFSH